MRASCEVEVSRHSSPRWLSHRSVGADRVTAAGYGCARPIADTDGAAPIREDSRNRWISPSRLANLREKHQLVAGLPRASFLRARGEWRGKGTNGEKAELRQDQDGAVRVLDEVEIKPGERNEGFYDVRREARKF